jgi:hypothetical protein
VGLGLHADTDVFDRRGEEGVGYSREGAREVVLRVAEGLGGAVGGFKGPFGVVEGAELDGDAGADAD